MGEQFAIKAEGLGKKYDLRQQAGDSSYLALRDVIAEGGKRLGSRIRHPVQRGGATRTGSNHREFWALQDVSFTIRPGERVGIIGRNGAGKSTLLKVLSRITDPTTGHARIRGRVASLLEVGTGFHPELTGRENIYLNGAVLGMSRADIRARFHEIVAFAEVETFLDTPVKRYSSGMYVRLAFAVAAHLEPDILIVDEVLAVGDASFQRKSLGKLRDIGVDGRTVLFVSHNMTALQALCEHAILLSDGRVDAIGSTAEVISKYLGQDVSSSSRVDLRQHTGRDPGSTPILQSIEFQNSTGLPSAKFFMGEALHIFLALEPLHPLHYPKILVGINNERGQRVFTVGTYFTDRPIERISGSSIIACALPSLSLMPGQYSVKLSIGTLSEDVDAIEEAAFIEVLPSDVFNSGRIPEVHQGMVVQESSWTVQSRDVISHQNPETTLTASNLSPEV